MTEVPIVLLVAQWILLLGLGALLIVVYRQLAYLMGLSRAATGGGGLPIGDPAPSFEYTELTANETADDGTPRTFSPKGAETLLMFTNPGCGSCGAALKNLEKATRGLRDSELRVVAVTDAEPAVVDAISEFRESPIQLLRVESEVPARLFRTYTTPFVYAIGRNGEVRGAQAAVTAGEIKQLIKELRSEIPTAQERRPRIQTSTEVPESVSEGRSDAPSR